MRLGIILPTEKLLLRAHIVNTLISTSPLYIPVPISIPVEIRQTYLPNVCVHTCESYETLTNEYSAVHGKDWLVTNISLN